MQQTHLTQCFFYEFSKYQFYFENLKILRLSKNKNSHLLISANGCSMLYNILKRYSKISLLLYFINLL